MKHRHLVPTTSQYSVAAVASILERGEASDITALLRALKADPLGVVAIATEQAILNSDVYGYPVLIQNCLAQWRSDVTR